jgi:hypothetical protein
MLDADTAKSLIKPRMPVVCSQDGLLAVVDHVEPAGVGARVVVLADGIPRSIPLAWVASVDDKVHLDRPSAQVRRAWS